MSKLKVWITDLGNPCQPAQRDWVIAVFNCHGQVIKVGNTELSSVAAPFGHAEIDLPPGSYQIRGTAHSWWSEGTLYGNWATDRACVTVCCNEDACVTLYAPSVQACWIPLFEVVFRDLVTKKVLNQEVLAAAQTIQKYVSQLPITEFEKAEREVLLKMYRNTQSK